MSLIEEGLGGGKGKVLKSPIAHLSNHSSIFPFIIFSIDLSLDELN